MYHFMPKTSSGSIGSGNGGGVVLLSHMTGFVGQNPKRRTMDSGSERGIQRAPKDFVLRFASN